MRLNGGRFIATGLMAFMGLVSSAAASAEVLRLACAVAYMPARSTWVRTLALTLQDQQIQSLTIDGVQPHAFALNGALLITAIDNERIQIDVAQGQWQSDFRGHAWGQGRCEVLA